jgi:hypothetical protein
MRLLEIIPEYVDTIPEELKEGILYISEKYGTAIHLCACGCGGKTVTGLEPYWAGGWTLTKVNDAVTLRPSIGNWLGENPYHAHYLITNNKIEWC